MTAQAVTALRPPDRAGGERERPAGPAAAIDAVFGVAVEPWLARARATFEARWAARLDARGARGVPPSDAVALFEPRWRRALLTVAERTLVLELNVARLRDALRGDDARARFASFGALLGDPGYRAALFAEYPELGRALDVVAEAHVRADLELVARAAADADALRRRFGAGRELGPVVGVRGGMGDSHAGGRTVSVLRFASGVQVVYKPRSLAAEARYAGLCEWLSRRGLPHALRCPAVLRRGPYGWAEYVARGSCPTRAAVRRYYWRLGAHLAPLYVLEATDLHLENVIAAGEHPMLVDLEALFHPRLALRPPEDEDRLGQEALMHSVLRIGLLPNTTPPERGGVVHDRSGVGGGEGQPSPRALLRYERPATDEMRLVPVHVPMSGADNRPLLRGAPAAPEAYVDDFVRGFRAAYRIMAAGRADLLAPGGPLSGFARDSTRVIVRGTMFYEGVLARSLHPNALRDAATRRAVIARALALGQGAVPARVAAAEASDIADGDVPIFRGRPDSVVVRDSRRREAHRLAHAPYRAVAARAERLGRDDLARQVSFVRGSFATLRAGAQLGSSARRRGDVAEPGAGAAATPEALEALARRCARRVLRLALRERGRVSWVGVATARERFWSLGQLSGHMYDGSAGIALALAYAAAVTDDAPARAVARQVVAQLVERFDAAVRHDPDRLPLGAFDGFGGLVYLLAHAGHLWGEPGLWAHGVVVARALARAVPADRQYDIIGGAAGLLCCVAALRAVCDDPSLTAAVGACADHLVRGAEPRGGGVGWTGGDRAAPLAGYSHGASGAAVALLRAARLTGDPRYTEVARSAFAYERELYVPALGNWRDLRFPEQVASMNAWCHGAPGIALARLEALRAGGCADDPALEQDLERALEATCAQAADPNDSLCHGALGNLAPIAEAARARPEARWAAVAGGRLAAVADRVRRNGPVCGTPGGVEAPGLLTGVAGIGHELLRHARPADVPCVLTLAPPPPRPGGRTGGGLVP